MMKENKFAIPPGVFDILPQKEKERWRSSYLWSFLEETIRQTVYLYGFQEIRTPIFERTLLFQRSVGETTDIVSKEMYTFLDKGGRSLSLRPEGTAPVIRSFLNHHLDRISKVHKFFYIGPMFRYERSQAGRYRQHHQFGVEIIGSKCPEYDAEMISLLHTFFAKLGLKKISIQISSLGDRSSRLKFKQALKDYLAAYFNGLSPESQKRFDSNPLRILDSKEKQDLKILAKAPSMLDFLSEESKEHFEEVQNLLRELNIPFVINPRIVRGLDYYNHTVFEAISEELGAQNSVGGGGRYDGLTKDLGGPDLPALGFAIGIERLLQVILKEKTKLPSELAPTLFLIALGKEGKKISFSLLHQLRQKGISVEMDHTNRKLNKLMRLADQLNAKYVIVIGEDEIQSQMVKLKKMATGETFKVSLKEIHQVLKIEEKREDFLKNWTEMSSLLETPMASNFFQKKLNESIKEITEKTKELKTVLRKIEKIL